MEEQLKDMFGEQISVQQELGTNFLICNHAYRVYLFHFTINRETKPKQSLDNLALIHLKKFRIIYIFEIRVR